MWYLSADSEPRHLKGSSGVRAAWPPSSPHLGHGMVDSARVMERIRVLIVDDHAGVSETISAVLALDSGIEVMGMEPTGQAGLDRALSDVPDIVLMDFALPDMTGAEAALALKAARPHIHVIGITASDEADAYDEAMNASMSAWMQKQDAVKDLRDTIHRVHAGERLIPDHSEKDGPPIIG